MNNSNKCLIHTTINGIWQVPCTPLGAENALQIITVPYTVDLVLPANVIMTVTDMESQMGEKAAESALSCS